VAVCASYRGRYPLVRRRAHTFGALVAAAGLRALRIHLCRRKTPADAGFGTLARCERHALHLVPGTLTAELSRIEIAVLGAGTEVPGADLPDLIAAVIEMVGLDPALAGVMGEPAEAGPSVQREHGVRRQGAEAHGRDVEQGHAGGLRTVRPTDIDAKRTARLGHRGGGKDEVFVAGGADS